MNSCCCSTCVQREGATTKVAAPIPDESLPVSKLSAVQMGNMVFEWMKGCWVWLVCALHYLSFHHGIDIADRLTMIAVKVLYHLQSGVQGPATGFMLFAILLEEARWWIGIVSETIRNAGRNN